MFHAKTSAKHFGGKPKDYLDIHVLIDSSREAFPDLRHRALTHNSWFITKIIPQIFGEQRRNSAKKLYSTRAVAELHVIEDFKHLFIPSAQDFLEKIRVAEWMDNAHGGACPPSHKMVKKYGKHPKRPKPKKEQPSKPVPTLKDPFKGAQRRMLPLFPLGRPKDDLSPPFVIPPRTIMRRGCGGPALPGGPMRFD